MFRRDSVLLFFVTCAVRSRFAVQAGLLLEPQLSSHKAYWAESTPTVCVVVRTHSKQRSSLLPTFATLVHSAPTATRFVFVDTDEVAFTELPSLVDGFNQLTALPLAKVSRWDQKLSRAEFPTFKKNDFGYIATDLVIEDLLKEREEARLNPLNAQLPCELLAVTNGDNLYSRDFFHATISVLLKEESAGLVATHFVSHYNNTRTWKPEMSGVCNVFRAGADAEFVACLKENHVDLGAVLMRTSLFETLTLPNSTHPKRFVVDRLRTQQKKKAAKINMFTLDGQLFSFFGTKTGSEIVHRTLFVHQ